MKAAMAAFGMAQIALKHTQKRLEGEKPVNVIDAVAQQYNAYPYPAPVSQISRTQVLEGDPSLYSALLWPEGRPRQRLDILSAGCGTMQAVSLAMQNPDCRVMGIDISDTSLEATKQLKDSYALSNLELRRMDIRDVARLGQNFDFVMCTGVLHHLPDPESGLRALASVLSPDGAMALMVYAKARRTGVYLLQDAFRRLGVTQDAAGIAFVREVIDGLPPSHYFNRLREIMPKEIDDATLIDTLLHPMDRAYSIPDIFALLDAGGMHFQGWMDNGLYFPEALLLPGTALWQRVQTLPFEQQWAIVENITLTHHKHCFVACRKDAPDRSLSFTGEWLDRYPVRSPAVSLVERASFSPQRNAKYRKRDTPFELQPPEAVLLDSCDGTKSVHDLIELPMLASNPPETRRRFVEAFIARMWKLGRIYLPVTRTQKTPC